MNQSRRRPSAQTDAPSATRDLQILPQGEISTADLLRAFAAISPNEREKAIIANLLGFMWLGAAAVQKAEWKAEKRTKFEPPPKPARREMIPSAPTTARLPLQMGTELRIGDPITLPRNPPAWLTGRVPVPLRRQEAAPIVNTPPPLFFPKWTSTILASSLSTPDVHAPIDVVRVVEKTAGGEALREIPRLRRGTLSRGVHVFFDTGEEMLPFRSDQRLLVQHIQRTFGSHNMRVIEFKVTPFEDSRGRWRRAQDDGGLRSGVPVLLLSDLGIRSGAAPSVTSQWLVFLARARNAGCPVIAFVPYAKSRWPYWLKRFMRPVLWDRR